MRPGLLGAQIPLAGQSGDIYWESQLGISVVYVKRPKQIEAVAQFYGQDDLRLERVAAFVGYLRDEALAAESPAQIPDTTASPEEKKRVERYMVEHPQPAYSPEPEAEQ